MKTFSETSGSVTCSAGEMFAVEARGTCAIGYVWFVEIADGSHSVELKARSLQPGQALGGMSNERFEFIAQHSGHADLVFALKQPWADRSARFFKLSIDICEQGNSRAISDQPGEFVLVISEKTASAG